MEKLKNILLIVTFVIASIAFAFALTFKNLNSKPKIVYVEITTLFDGFDMSTELNSSFEKTNQLRTQLLDSLKLNLDVLEQKITSTDENSTKRNELIEKYKSLSQNYLNKQQVFNEDNNIQAQEYDKQIWQRLNSYIEEYRLDNDYDIILGANGSGSILAIDNAIEVTDEAIEYINIRYNGE